MNGGLVERREFARNTLCYWADTFHQKNCGYGKGADDE